MSEANDGEDAGRQHVWPDCLERIRPYHEVRHDLREVIGWLREVDDTLYGLEWQAAGGIGTASRERAVESIDAQIANLQTLREQVEELEDPRSLHTSDGQ